VSAVDPADVPAAGASVGASVGADPFAWLPGTVVAVTPQTSRARSITLSVPGLRPARAGQHVDVRLTADDGYTAVRSYSLSDVRGSWPPRSVESTGGAARVPEGEVTALAGSTLAGQVVVEPEFVEPASVEPASVEPASVEPASVEITVERLDDGEVSPYLVDGAEVGDPVEVRGPIGGWFVWPPTEFEPDSAVHAVLPEPEGATPPTLAPVQLIGGGSGVAPLTAMVRARRRDAPPMRLLASVRDPGSRWFVAELDEAARASSGVSGHGAGAGGAGLSVDWVYSRVAPEGHGRPAGRLTRDELERLVLPAAEHPLVYVCGANSFVEVVAGWLVELGHAPTRVRTERFGGV